MLITIRPGPVLHLWKGQAEVAAMPLSETAALALCRDLLGALPSAGRLSAEALTDMTESRGGR